MKSVTKVPGIKFKKSDCRYYICHLVPPTALCSIRFSSCNEFLSKTQPGKARCQSAVRLDELIKYVITDNETWAYKIDMRVGQQTLKLHLLSETRLKKPLKLISITL